MRLRIIVLAVLVGALYRIQTQIDEKFGNYRATEEILYVENGALMKKVMVGFENLAADLYWLRTVQYFGGQRSQVTGKNYDLLEPLLNITIDLDPDFKIAYTYGATFLSEPFPMGAGLPSKGIEIIERGMENHPEYWRFYLDKGFIYFWHLKDCEKAAEVFLEGSELPGAPYWMIATAGRTLGGCGERDTARGLWQLLYETAETDQQRDNAVIHLRQLDALDQIDILRETITTYHENTDAYPSSWQELIQAGFLKGAPLDPTGSPYVLDSTTHDVELSPASTLGVLPTR